MPSPIPEPLVNLLQRPVAVLGAGVSGQGVLALLATINARGVVYDERADNARRSFNATTGREHGLVVYSPGFAPEHAWLVAARDAGCTCLGELDFASLFWRGDLIAVTGTNGKTSLTEFLAHALTTAGRRAQATGNVGYSFSRLVVEQTGKVDVAVCEVSSFQAETLCHLRPTATLWTNFAEDHLERHAGLGVYFAAKRRLLERTPEGGRLVGSSVARLASVNGWELPAVASVQTENQPDDPALAGSLFATYPQRENFLLASAWWRLAGLPADALYAAAQTFQAGNHRLCRVGEKNGVTFWNDSKATNFHAVEAALATFAGPVLWVGGGKSKGGDLAAFIRRIATKVRHAFLIGETQSALLGHCGQAGVPATACASLADAVKGAFAMAVKPDHVLLSPGFASFDMFRGYDDRGRQFEAIVGNL
jgi:UDP-N-acetylmuramoylalanine--D-glutamate ligase